MHPLSLPTHNRYITYISYVRYITYITTNWDDASSHFANISEKCSQNFGMLAQRTREIAL